MKEVQDLLRAATYGQDAPAVRLASVRRNGGLDWSRLSRRPVAIPAGPVNLTGDLRSPPEPTALVIFVHGSGSSRLSPRNVQVATALGSCGFATLLFDLLDERESANRHNVFDINLLTGRLLAATDWALREAELGSLPLGYFGAAAALSDGVRAVVSRGGRPDLAEHRLSEVRAPTLLIVGGDDWNVLELNDEAATQLHCPHELAVVPHAGHLFEEPGALERVTELAADWFATYLGHAASRDAA